MFRYIAIVWDASQAATSTHAERLGRVWQARSAWNTEWIRPGLQVFSTGAQAGVNSATSLMGSAQSTQGLVLGKLFRRRELDSTPQRGIQLTDKEGANILASGGRALVSEYWGRYVAFLQTSTGSTRVLRDPSGTLPCYCFEFAEIFIVFSWLEDALEMLGEQAPGAVNWNALAAQLLRSPLTGRQTTLQGVLQVLPGEIVDLQLQRSTLLWRAVRIAGSPAPYDSDEAAQLLRGFVRACTREWANCYDTLLVRLSGGVDSSILFSCLGPGATTADVMGINYFSAGSDSDERHYARLTAAKVGRDLLERERDACFELENVLQIARMPDPVPYIGWLNTATDARLAATYAATALFTGAGGDSLFYQFPQWWPAADYLRTKGLGRGFGAAMMSAARLGKVSVWRAVRMALREHIRPNPDLREFQGPTTLLSADLQHRHADWERFAHPDLQGAVDLPIGKYMQTLALMQPVGYYDPFEQAQAPESVNPLLSQPLVELCLRLPTYLLSQGGRGRALARQAFTADLPPQIINRRSKGGMEEHITAVLHRNLQQIRELLLEGQLCNHGLVDRKRLEELLSDRPSRLVVPVGQIHALAAVEAWLSRWQQ